MFKIGQNGRNYSSKRNSTNSEWSKQTEENEENEQIVKQLICTQNESPGSHTSPREIERHTRIKRYLWDG